MSFDADDETGRVLDAHTYATLQGGVSHAPKRRDGVFRQAWRQRPDHRIGFNDGRAAVATSPAIKTKRQSTRCLNRARRRAKLRGTP